MSHAFCNVLADHEETLENDIGTVPLFMRSNKLNKL